MVADYRFHVVAHNSMIVKPLRFANRNPIKIIQSVTASKRVEFGSAYPSGSGRLALIVVCEIAA